jgi:hypothetical protein
MDELRQARSTQDDGRYGELVLGARYEYDRGAYLDTTDEVRSLIAAAPDMLALIERIANGYHADNARASSRDIIKKAKAQP